MNERMGGGIQWLTSPRPCRKRGKRDGSVDGMGWDGRDDRNRK